MGLWRATFPHALDKRASFWRYSIEALVNAASISADLLTACNTAAVMTHCRSEREKLGRWDRRGSRGVFAARRWASRALDRCHFCRPEHISPKGAKTPDLFLRMRKRQAAISNAHSSHGLCSIERFDWAWTPRYRRARHLAPALLEDGRRQRSDDMPQAQIRAL